MLVLGVIHSVYRYIITPTYKKISITRQLSQLDRMFRIFFDFELTGSLQEFISNHNNIENVEFESNNYK